MPSDCTYGHELGRTNTFHTIVKWATGDLLGSKIDQLLQLEIDQLIMLIDWMHCSYCCLIGQ